MDGYFNKAGRPRFFGLWVVLFLIPHNMREGGFLKSPRGGYLKTVGRLGCEGGASIQSAIRLGGGCVAYGTDSIIKIFI